MMTMKQEEVRERGSIGGGGAWARLCDTCRVVPCTVYCRADSAYLCTGCDARVHGANHVASRHERVWVCEACEQAPAAFLCKADAASLCAACDADVHSANPLSRRHHRVPILPIATGGLYGGPPAVGDRVVGSVGGEEEEDFLAPEIEEGVGEEDDEDETASWLLPNPVKGDKDGVENNNNNDHGYVMGGELVDEHLHLVEYNSGSGPDSHQYGSKECDLQKDYVIDNTKSCGGDSVVPVQSKVHFHYQQHHKNHNEQGFNFGFDYETNPAYSSYNTTMSHSVSVSSLDVGIVPESTMNSDIPSISTPRIPTKGTIDLFSGPPAPIQLPTVFSPMDREARVLRYREKKKTRKFEKTIRYASRKAYAETRPRIKGRFAKRSEVEEVEVDQMFSNGIMAGAAR
ncbi:Zinc finger protein CONSTANS-LIKE 2-like protein [Drosera capensis]